MTTTGTPIATASSARVAGVGLRRNSCLVWKRISSSSLCASAEARERGSISSNEPINATFRRWPLRRVIVRLLRLHNRLCWLPHARGREVPPNCLRSDGRLPRICTADMGTVQAIAWIAGMASSISGAVFLCVFPLLVAGLGWEQRCRSVQRVGRTLYYSLVLCWRWRLRIRGASPKKSAEMTDHFLKARSIAARRLATKF